MKITVAFTVEGLEVEGQLKVDKSAVELTGEMDDKEYVGLLKNLITGVLTAEGVNHNLN